MTDFETDEQRRLSRRSVIKGTVGATAAMWAAPAVTTLGGSANAVSLVPQCRGGRDWSCGDEIENCGATGPLALCVCDQTVEGSEFCWENFFCGGAQACAASSECPRGYACVTTCCGQTCAPVCGTNANQVERVVGGANAAGS